MGADQHKLEQKRRKKLDSYSSLVERMQYKTEHTVHENKEVAVDKIVIKFNGFEWRLILTATGQDDGGRVVMFTQADDLGTAVIKALTITENGQGHWREDKPWTPQA